MTLIRRAPREVYRVYSEAEFLADPLCDEQVRNIDATAGVRRLNRIAGATVLVAAAGAVGAMIAWTSTPSIAGSRRRERPRTHPALASNGPTPASAPRVWRVQEGGARSAHVRASGHPASRRDHSQPQTQRARRHEITPSPIGALRQVSTLGQRGTPSPTPPVMAASPVDASSPAAAVPATPAPSDETEFGFER
jgi:hypothetical protein